MFASDKVEVTVEAMFLATEPSMAEVARRQVVDRHLEEAQKKLTRFKEASAAGVDPHLAAARINGAQKEVTETLADRAVLSASAATGPTRRTAHHGCRPQRTAQPPRPGPVAVRADIYAALDVRLTYGPSTAFVEAEVSPSHEMSGKTSVRGGT